MDYNFGPAHPLLPERLQRLSTILTALRVFDPIDPGPGNVEDVLRVHAEDYVDAIRKYSEIPRKEYMDEQFEEAYSFGFGTLDVPAFPAMYTASLAYCAGTAAAARCVASGEALAYSIGGGLHHALRSKAAGFCIFYDCAIACDILLEKYDRVAYVDIDVHHGDGVQWMYYDDPRVLTCSIHEDPRSLWPGTGAVDESGADFTSLNVPILDRTTGDVWLETFRNTIIPALELFNPGAIVLQMGADSHYLDPLAHLRNDAANWLGAVESVRDLNIPIVALGGGGYDITTVPRMWAAACLALNRQEVPRYVPEPMASKWKTPTFLDENMTEQANVGRSYARLVTEYIGDHHLKHLNRSAG